MSRIFTLASGSSGNCTFIGCGKGGVLIDAGISAKAITEGLSAIAFEPSLISAIFITQEHIDHINGLRVFSNKYRIPVFASKSTIDAISKNCCIDSELLNVTDGETAIGDFSVSRFATSHDCEGSSGYTVLLPDGKKCSVCTDLGIVTDEVRTALKGSNTILIESNHDINMLHKGSYPEYLKHRISSNTGHLSNNACAQELGGLVKSGTTRILLGHLSRENNRPELARNASTAALMEHKMIENEDYLLYVAPRGIGKAVIF